MARDRQVGEDGPGAAVPARKMQKRSAVRVEQILAEAMAEFSRHGYESSSTRRIAQRAGLAHQLLLYHFKTKDNLWREVILEAARRYRAWFDLQLRAVEGCDDLHRLRTIQAEFVRFAARNPELHSILMHGTGQSRDRLDWLVTRLVTPVLEMIIPLIKAVQATGHYVAGDPVHVQYAFMGSITRLFMLAPEVAHLTGRSPLAPEFVEQHVQLCLSLFFRDPPCPDRIC